MANEKINFNRAPTLPDIITADHDGIWFIKPNGSTSLTIYIIVSGIVINLDAVTGTELNSVVSELQTDIDLRALASDVYRKIETYSRLQIDQKISDAVVRAQIQWRGSAVPTDPAPTGDGFWIVSQQGTYTNFGGVELEPPASMGVISRLNGTFSISPIIIDLSQYATKDEAVLKENFSDAIAIELGDGTVSRTYGQTAPYSSLNVSLNSHYYWTSPSGVSRVIGTIDSLSVRLLTAGQVSFVVGSASPTSGGFTVLRTLGTFAGVVGLNTFTLSPPQAINADEIVAITGNNTATMNFGTGEHTSTDRWVQQTATAFVNSQPGYWLYSYDVTGVNVSELYNVFPTKEDTVLKSGFGEAISTELEGTEVTSTLGVVSSGSLSIDLLANRFHWTYPAGISNIEGTIDMLSVTLETAGPVIFVVGSAQYDQGGFTVRKTLGTFEGVAGINNFTLTTPEPISVGETVAIFGDGAASVLLGTQTTYGTRWVRQTSTAPIDSSVGWVPYSYRVTGLRQSVLYDVFPTKVELENDYVSQSGFGEALEENIEGTDTVVDLGKLTGSLTLALSPNRYLWTYPDNIAPLKGTIDELSVKLATGGQVFFAIGSALPDQRGFTSRKLIGPFTGTVGLNTFPLTTGEVINKDEIVALALPLGQTTTAVINFASSAGSRWVRQTSTGYIDSASGWWSVGYKMSGVIPSILDDRYVRIDNMGDPLSDYLQKGTEYPIETVGSYGEVSVTVSGGSIVYIGNNLPFSSDGRIETIRFNAPVAGTVLFAIGDIDQFGIFLEEKTFSKTVVVGSNVLNNINTTVRQGQVLLIKNSLSTYNSSSGGEYIQVNEVGGVIEVVEGSVITYNVDYTPIAAPVIASANSVNDLTTRVTALESSKSSVISSIPSGFEYRLTCNDDGSNIRTVSAWPSKGIHFGNSITRHPITSFWWGVWGMAASERAKDYVHVLESLIKTKNPLFAGTATGNGGWETNHIGFDYSVFNSILTSDVDLVTLVLGDNTQNTTGFENSCFEFLSYIRNRLPTARILCTDNWYYSQVKADAWKSAAEQVPNVKFVSIKNIRNGQTEAGMGTIVKGDDGQEHVINNSGVATHPGDLGMKGIADRLFQNIL